MLRLKFFFKNDNCSWQNMEFLRTVRSHPESIKYLFHTKKITRSEQNDWYNEVYNADSNYLIWLVYDTKMQTPVAYIQYHIESLIHRRCTAGYVIAPEFSCLKKYDKQVIKLMVKNMNGWRDDIHRLQVMIFPEDIVRLNSLTENGFEVDGIIRDYVHKDGEYRDIYVLSHILPS